MASPDSALAGADDSFNSEQDSSGQQPMSEQTPIGGDSVNVPRGTPPVGAAVHARHGGLITGLAGVLLDGLQAAVTTPDGPNQSAQAAQKAIDLPQQRRQQQIQIQSQQQMLKVQQAQAHVQQAQTRLLASSLDDEIASGMSDAAWKFASNSVSQGTAKMVSGTGTREAAFSKLKELHDQASSDTQGNYFAYPSGKAKDGTSEWAVYETFPSKTLTEDTDFDLPGTKDQGGQIENLHKTFPAGTPMSVYTSTVSQLSRDQAAKIHSETQANKPQKPVTGEEAAYQQALQSNPKLSRLDFHKQWEAAKPQKPATPEKAQDMAIGELNGRQVAGTVDELKAGGAQGIVKAGAAEAEKVQNARSLLNVFDSSDADDPGLIQLTDKLDKEGKLGPAMIKFQNWLNQGGKSIANFNVGDPDVQRLFTKMGLANTGLMQVHVGARGSAQMLEHFEDLANAKNMSVSAFKAGLDAEHRYVRMKAMQIKPKFSSREDASQSRKAAFDPSKLPDAN